MPFIIPCPVENKPFIGTLRYICFFVNVTGMSGRTRLPIKKVLIVSDTYTEEQ